MKPFSPLLLFLMLTFITACSSENHDNVPDYILEYDNLTVFPPLSDEAPVVEFTEEITFPDPGDEMLTAFLSNVTVDDNDRVYFFDGAITAIRLFNPDGSYVGSFGRDGEGPGEFRTVQNMKVSGDRIYFYDSRLRRINFYSTETLEHTHSIIMDPENWRDLEDTYEYSNIRAPYFLDDGSFMVSFSLRPDDDFSYAGYYRMNPDGNVSPTLHLKTKNGSTGTFTTNTGLTMAATIQFGRNTLLAIAGDGHMYRAWSEDFLIEVFNAEGQYLHAYYHPYEKRILDRQKFLETHSQWRDEEFPATWPALNTFLVDDSNRLWVETVNESDEIEEWWVMAESGNILGRFEKKPNVEQSIQTVAGDKIYMRERDEEGLYTIVRYQIEFP